MDQNLYVKLAAVAKFYQHDSNLAHKYKEAEANIEWQEAEFKRRKRQAEKKITRFFYPGLGLCGYGVIFLVILVIVGAEFKWCALAALAVTIGAVILCAVRKCDKKCNAEYEKLWDNEFVPEIVKAQDTIERVKANRQRLYKEYGSLPAFLPEKYRNLQAVSFIFISLKDGRAETLKEAYNLYEEQLHRWKLEAAVNRAAEMQQLVAMAIDELNSQQADTNAYLSAIEQYEFIKYIHPDQN